MGWGDALFWYKLLTSEVSWPSASPLRALSGVGGALAEEIQAVDPGHHRAPWKTTFLHWLHLFWVMGHSVKSCAALLRPLKPICGTSYSPNPHLLRKTRFITRLAW